MVTWRKFEGSAFEYDKHVIRLGGGLYQSYAWGEMKRAADQIPLRLVALEGVEIVATVSVMVRRRYGIVVAWVPGGPAGNLRFFGQEFREALVELTRGAFLYCRLAIEAPSTDEDKETLSHVEWMKPRKIIGSGLTMHYSLLDDEEYRLDRATANWRHNYRRSARHGLTVEQWIEPDIASMENIYREMETLKSLPIQQTKQTLERMVETLGNQLIVYRCLDPNGKLICFRAAALFGNRAWDMLAGATGIARKTYASYATLWALTNHCRKLGAAIYDLSGVDPVHNKGVFDFKSGIGSELVECLGEWEWASHPLLARLANWYIARNL